MPKGMWWCPFGMLRIKMEFCLFAELHFLVTIAMIDYFCTQLPVARQLR